MSLLLEQARALDAADPLARFREQFFIANPEMIYLDGNSLGRLPLRTETLMADLIRRQWGEQLIQSWNEGWFTLPERVGGKLAQLIGAQADEVIVADSTSINLFKLVVASLRLQRGRSRILTDDLNFPSDIYVLQGIVGMLGAGHQLEIVRSEDGVHGPVEALLAALDENVALVVLSHTVFKSGYVYDMKAVTEAVHAVGGLMLWDLSHSVGSIPVELNAAQADLAVGCTYKYVNGGPGAPAFLYVRRDLQEHLQNPISGWMGQRAPFDFTLEYAPEAGIRRFLTGTPPILSMALIEPGVDLLLEAGMEALRAKSIQQTSLLVHLWEEKLASLGYTLKSPRQPEQRGSHISLGHPEGWRINQALIHDLGVLPDFRAPDNIRLGIAPLYTSFVDVYTAAERLQRAVEEQIYMRYSSRRATVT
ncbi:MULTISPECIES: kynureninase [Caldilinea]|jgi:kynureninase|uniref:Kynureninase n=1 Tax=Caldilinea aerophila (strain DSM 14535 / JCM 11387 / NBRC 104270 / STL-6-O1) TaxID=926550 RepID=I0I042_CALAS|nr:MULTISPECIES: kynureninase [Caldilinea]MBO9393654.1 kynureninase [Caldilinea sp.]BAL98629.1 putative kynureninase [Caldilinea aerophila DSM 14535 = NBRC 104270]GIV74788.1 MAG: kynureninase [Caldilinea sp.]